mmetsp:Transcript_23082/g.48050  ORF Transcript_23082/g.48050 Transcript_23082/m.48050 type:complete len:212 (+) Transcript_23082:774-1409(+)
MHVTIGILVRRVLLLIGRKCVLSLLFLGLFLGFFEALLLLCITLFALMRQIDIVAIVLLTLGLKANICLPLPKVIHTLALGISLLLLPLLFRLGFGISTTGCPGLSRCSFLVEYRTIQKLEASKRDNKFLAKVRYLGNDWISLHIESCYALALRKYVNDIIVVSFTTTCTTCSNLVVTKIYNCNGLAFLQMGNTRNIRQRVLGNVECRKIG